MPSKTLKYLCAAVALASALPSPAMPIDSVHAYYFGNNGLYQVVEGEKWGRSFDRPTDIGDIAACSYLIREYLKLNPKGRAYIYTAWPGIPAARELRDAINHGKPRGERRKPNYEEIEPLRRSFDYEAAWLAGEIPGDAPPDAPARTEPHTRRHMTLVMQGLINAFPELWRDGRLGMVPMGDVFLALDRKMRTKEVPGLVNIGEFSADGGHLRRRLPRYTLAATHYAVLFRDDPACLDWNLYQDRDNYESNKFGHYVHQPDRGVHVDITPERARIVNQTTREVVRNHPYTQIRTDHDL